MTTENKVTIQITRDGNPANKELIWWRAHACLAYGSDDEWYDLNCKCRGEPVSECVKLFLWETAEFNLNPGERKLVEIRTI